MEKKNSNNLTVCVICGILTAFGIVTSIISFVNRSNDLRIVNDVINLLLSVLIGYYAFWGYRKPHGTLLKSLILLYAASRLLTVNLNVTLGNAWVSVLFAVIIGLCCYIAGRLHRVKQNMILMSIVTALLLVRIVAGFVEGGITIGVFAYLIIWTNICVAYVLRYKEHKEAGFADTAKG